MGNPTSARRAKDSRSGDRRHLFAIALGLWGLVLWVFQFSTLAKMSEHLPVNAFFGTFEAFSPYLSDPRSPIRLDLGDTLLAFLLLALPAWMLYLQTRFRAMPGAWELLAGRPWKKALFLFAFFATLSRFAVHPGNFPFLGDGSVFLAGADEAHRSFSMGAFPDYSTLFYSGWNIRQYIGNLFSVLAGFFAFVFDSNAGIKLFLLLAHALSGVGAFLWLERLTKSRAAALFAGVAFCLSYWHFHQIFILGRLHLSIVYACMPWPFYLLERGLQDRDGRLRWFLLAAIPLAGSMYTHFVWGAMTWGLFVVYGIARLATRAERGQRADAWTSWIVAFLLQALILGGMLSAPFVRKDESNARHSVSAFEEISADQASRVRTTVLHTWYNGHWSVFERPQLSWYNTYLGLSLSLFALLGLAAVSRRRFLDAGGARILAAFLLGNAALVFYFHELVSFAPLRAFRIFPDHRYQTFLVLFLAAGAALGAWLWARWASARFNGWKRNLMVAVPLTVLALDLGTTSFQIPFGAGAPWRESPYFEQYRQESRAYLEKNENVPYTFFLEGQGMYDYGLRTPALKASLLGMPSDLGIQPQTGPRSYKFRETFYTGLVERLKQPHLFPDPVALDYFYLHAFRDVIVVGRPGLMFDTTALTDLTTDGYYVQGRLRRFSPVVASTVAEPYGWNNEADTAELARHYAAMGIDRATATARRLFLAEGAARDSLGDPVGLELELLEYKALPKGYFYRLRLDRPAYVRLAASHFSFLTARLDGRAVEYLPSATRDVVVKVPAGEHTLEIKGGWDPWRKAWLFVALAAFALIAWLAIRRPAGLIRASEGPKP